MPRTIHSPPPSIPPKGDLIRVAQIIEEIPGLKATQAYEIANQIEHYKLGHKSLLFSRRAFYAYLAQYRWVPE